MSLTELLAKWDADPEFRALYGRMYPHDQEALQLMEHRARLGLTQAAYAHRIKVGRSAVEKWESGTYPVPAAAFR